MKRLLLLALFASTYGIGARAQSLNPCPPTSSRQSVEVRNLKGFIADSTWAVIPKVQITLQERSVEKFRDIKAVTTDAEGKFDFGTKGAGRYRLFINSPRGFCRINLLVELSEKGWPGVELAIPVAAHDACPWYCDASVQVRDVPARFRFEEH